MPFFTFLTKNSHFDTKNLMTRHSNAPIIFTKKRYFHVVNPTEIAVFVCLPYENAIFCPNISSWYSSNRGLEISVTCDPHYGKNAEKRITSVADVRSCMQKRTTHTQLLLQIPIRVLYSSKNVEIMFPGFVKF